MGGEEHPTRLEVPSMALTVLKSEPGPQAPAQQHCHQRSLPRG